MIFWKKRADSLEVDTRSWRENLSFSEVVCSKLQQKHPDWLLKVDPYSNKRRGFLEYHVYKDNRNLCSVKRWKGDLSVQFTGHISSMPYAMDPEESKEIWETCDSIMRARAQEKKRELVTELLKD